MPPRKRTSPALNAGDPSRSEDMGEMTDHDTTGSDTTGSDEALSLADRAETAEAEAIEAEAVAAAARARTRALRLRQQAEAAATKTVATPAVATPAVSRTSDVEETDTTDVHAPTGETASLAEEVDEEGAEAPGIDAEHVDEDGEAREFDDDDEDPIRRRRRRLKLPHISLKFVAAALVVLLSLGLFGAGGFMVWQHRKDAAEQQRSAEFAAAARQGVVTLMSLDFNHAEDDVKRILDNTTGDFRKDFEGQAAEFVKVAQTSKVVTEATVNVTAVEKMTRDTATVLVAATSTVSNAASKEKQPRSWRLSVDVARDGEQIKMAKVEFVP